MEIKSLENYKFGEPNVSTLYASTYIDGTDVPLYPFVLDKQHEMRIDLVSNDMFGSVDYVDLVMELNDIINPFSLREGMLLYYTDLEKVRLLSQNVDQYEELRNALIDANKRQKTDPARMSYKQRQAQIEQDKRALPPTFRKEGVESSTFAEGNIYLHPGI